MILFNLLKDGKKNAVTLSYDDAPVHDRRLVDIFNKYGMKATFHINSGVLGENNGKIEPEEIKELYKNHEVACHGVMHARLDLLSKGECVTELYEDRKALEQLCGYIVRGLSYAYGRYTDDVLKAVENCDIEYSRTVKGTMNFEFPENWLEWNPTCHHNNCLEYGEKFLNSIEGFTSGPRLLYVWGHSYEFSRQDNWDVIEEFCKLVGGRDDIWYATNIEIYDYIKAQRSLIVSVDGKTVYNPSGQEVWFSCTDTKKAYSVKPGETKVVE